MKRALSLLLVLLLTVSSLALGIAAEADTGWDGTTATKPEGEGTPASPYLVASAENLLWISQNIQKGDEAAEGATVGASFEGVWFKQTADIDLNGKSINAIGYFYESPTRMAAFGGVYNGAGFTIKNGTVTEPKSYVMLPENAGDTERGSFREFRYGAGLFGVIYGATICNLNLDGIVVNGLSNVGVCVGRAACATEVNQDLDIISPVDAGFNKILNVTVSATCDANCTFEFTSEANNWSNYDLTGRVGGIVGAAYRTDVWNCTNNAPLDLSTGATCLGGIAGTVGINTNVEYCVNTAKLTLDTTNFPNKSETAVGGIVGFISPFATGRLDVHYPSSFSIKNCYNTGSFEFVGTANSGATYWGGILGGANSMYKKCTCVIDGCYNLNSENVLLGSGKGADNFRIGGLVGSYWVGNGSNNSALCISNSYSVKLEKGGNTSTYTGTNEFRGWIERILANNKSCYQIGLADGTYANQTVAEYAPTATVGTKSAEEINALVDVVKNAMIANNTESLANNPVAPEDPTTPGDDPTTPGDDPTTPGDDPTTPGTESGEVDPPAVTDEPATNAPETNAPEPDAPGTNAPATTTGSGSTTSEAGCKSAVSAGILLLLGMVSLAAFIPTSKRS